MNDNESEPPAPSAASAALFLIGRDSHGHWVAQDRDGLRGGLFVNRAEAVKFALFENGNQRQSVVMTSDPLDLDMTRKPTHDHAVHGRRAA